METKQNSIINVFKNSGIEAALAYCLPYCADTGVCSITCTYTELSKNISVLLAAVDSTEFTRSDVIYIPNEKASKLPNMPKDYISRTAFYVNNFKYIPDQNNILLGYENFHSFLNIPINFESGFNFSITLFSSQANAFNERKLEKYKQLFEPLFLALEESFLLQKESQNRFFQSKLSTSRALLDTCTDLVSLMRELDAIAKENIAVLITGETGVGKELMADAIYESSNSFSQAFVKINCASIPESLADSLFFGHERGSFTNAFNIQKGYFEQANNGFLFLDEVGELSLDIQAKLLRVLDRQVVQRIGSSVNIPIQVRIISATNRDLLQMVQEGRFRLDLWYRLSQFIISVPPLRERKKDIILLTDYYIKKHRKENENITMASIPKKEKEKLLNYNWNGNVRELEYTIFKALIKMRLSPYHRSVKFDIEQKNIPIPIKQSYENMSLEELTNKHIQDVLLATNNVVDGPNGAAAILKIHPQTLYRKLKTQNLL